MSKERSTTNRSRNADTRKADETAAMERPPMDRWSPSTTLETPPDTADWKFRWIAEYVNGQHMPRNVQQALREGYQRVNLSEISDEYIFDEDMGDGWARTGGLILMKFPQAFAAQREQYYLNRSKEALNGANELQGIAGRDSVEEDRGTRALEGAEAGRALQSMSQR